MTRQDVVRIYQLLATHGIKIWVDGGFSVDALVGRATREHSDLDIAVERRDAERLCAVLADDGFSRLPREDLRSTRVDVSIQDCLRADGEGHR